MNKSESKYFNTAARMDQALIALLAKKEFAFITVQEICEKAGVNRSTFYLHYENTGDLLEEAVRYAEDRFFSCFHPDSRAVMGRIETCRPEELMFITPEYLTPYLNFIRENRLLYCAAMEKPDLMGTERIYQAMFRNVFDPVLARFHYPAELRWQAMKFYIGGICAVVKEWLKNDCRDPAERIIHVLECCVYPGGKEYLLRDVGEYREQSTDEAGHLSPGQAGRAGG